MTAFIPTSILVTGGAGFIGSNFIRWVLQNQPDVSVVNLDLLTYAGNLENLARVFERHGVAGDGRYIFVRGDIRDNELVSRLLQSGDPDGNSDALGPPNALVNFAAESHVDRSILGPAAFVETNVGGTLNLLEACRTELSEQPRDFRFLHVSTDEVYGSLGSSDPPFTEETALVPNSPYAASKAGGDMLVRAYGETFELPVVTTRCSNNYGPYQFPEKLIPLMITRALSDDPLPVYGDGMNVRDWVHVEDHVEALWSVICKGRLRRIYNIGGESEIPNLEVINHILDILAKPRSLVEFVRDRPGHDRRYAMDITRIGDEIGWSPRRNFIEGLQSTVEWYLANRGWWERILSEAYRSTSELYLTG